MAQADGHGETKVVHGPHGCSVPLLELLGGYTLQTRNPDSWEGWYWGAKHVWGMEPIGLMMPQTNAYSGYGRKYRNGAYTGAVIRKLLPGALAARWSAASAIGLPNWVSNQIYICPDLNYGAAVHADKWIPILPNTDAALQLAIAYIWITEGTYDKEYVKTHTVGFDKFRIMFWGKKMEFPRPRSGQRRNAEFLPEH